MKDNKSNLRKVFAILTKTSKRSQLNGRVLKLESLENRELLSASTLQDALTTEELVSSKAIVASAENAAAPIDLSGADLDADWIVDSNLDDGSEGTLRYALERAQSGDKIVFADSLKGATITLVGGQLSATKSVAIDASSLYDAENDAPGLTIDANQSGRIFHFSGSQSNVELVGLNLTGGSVDGAGGAIYAASVNLTVANSVFEGNAATGTGGAIRSAKGALTLSNVAFTSNASTSSGGVISANGGILTINDSAFVGNVATNSGGVIYLSSETAVVSGATFTGNETEKLGGVIAATNDSSVTVDGSTFSGNTAISGGAIYQTGGSLAITNGVLTENSSRSYGGAAYLKGVGEATITSSTITKNTTSSFGGAIAATGNTNITSTDAAFSENNASIGGAFYQVGGSLALTDGAVSENGAKTSGGAIYQANAQALTISGATFADNTAVGNGGAIYVVGSTVTIQSSENSAVSFTGNASQKFGGAIYASKVNSLTLTGGQYLNNEAYAGGALYGGSVAASVVGGEFNANRATQNGGAFFLTESQGDVSGASFESNTASANGGAVYSITGGLTVSDGTTFTSNTSTGLGGAVYQNGGALTVDSTVFTANATDANGGAIYQTKVESNISGVEFIGNSADVGAAAYVGAGTANVSSTQFVGNTATGKGAGLFASGATVVAENALFAENAAPNGAALFVGNASNLTIANATLANNSGVSVVRLNSSTGAIKNSVVALNDGTEFVFSGGELNAFNTLSSFDGWTSGANNVSYDAEAPLFVEGGYELADDSQAIDLGDNAYVTSEFDLAGAARIVNDVVDLGAYENQKKPFVPVVTSVADDGSEGTLRYVVANAEAGTTITFAPELSGQTIALSGTAIEISKSLTIDASGLENGIVIDAQGNSRAFTIVESADAASLVGLTITNGNATGSASSDKTGGAIYSYGVDLTLDQITVTSSTAASMGGALYAQLGSVTITDSSFTGSVANLGSALYFHTTDSAILRGVTVSDSVTKNSGAVQAMQCELSVYDSVFMNNTSKAVSELMSGAAISLYSNYGVVPHRPANAYVENSVFEGNKTAMKNGGAISANAGLTLTIVNSDFVNNEAGNGGAISVEGSELEVTGSRFIGNVASDKGGAIYTSSALLAVKDPETGATSRVNPDPTVTLRDTLIADNEANDGGAFYFSGYEVGTTYTLVNTTIANNTTTKGDSGALKSSYGVGSVYNSIFALNTGADISTTGTVSYAHTLGAGGEYAYDATRALFTDAANGDYSLADGSQAIDLGDNMYVTSEFDLAGAARIVNDVVDLGAYENQKKPFVPVVTSVADDGSEGTLRYVVANAEAGTTITFAPELSGQTIALSGTAIEISKSLTIDASGLEDGIVIDAQGASRAFRIVESAGTASLVGLTITNGNASGSVSADKTGGAIYSYGVDLTLDQITATNCTAASMGGAVYAQLGSVTVTNSSFTGSVANLGSALYFHTTESATLRGVTVSDSVTKNSGAVQAMQCELSVYDSVFRNNTSNAVSELMSGAAIALFSNYGQIPHRPANAYVENSVFEGNKTTTKNGGAISANAGLTLTIVNSDFVNNEAVCGGAISVEGSELEVTGSRFIGNAASDKGGAIYTSSALLAVKDPETGATSRVNPDPTVTIRDTLIAENEANDGGALYFSGNEVGTTYTLVNTTIAKNTTTKGDSGALKSLYGIGAIYNSIFAQNSGADVSTTGTVSYAHTLGAGGEYAYDSTRALFTDAVNGDYSLADGSQAIDLGDNAYVTSEFDLAGAARIVNDVVDLGAYENQGASDALLDEAFAELLNEGFDEAL